MKRIIIFLLLSIITLNTVSAIVIPMPVFINNHGGSPEPGSMIAFYLGCLLFHIIYWIVASVVWVVKRGYDKTFNAPWFKWTIWDFEGPVYNMPIINIVLTTFFICEQMLGVLALCISLFTK